MTELLMLLQDNNKGFLVVAIAIVLDIVSGLIKATLKHDVRSSAFREGLLKKVLDLVIIVVAFSMDFLLGLTYIGKGVLFSIVAMEFYSVLENVKEYMPLPEALVNAMDLLQGRK